jgi:hypothetical protein
MLHDIMNHHHPELHRSRPADYCRKLKSGLARLKEAVQTEYQSVFPDRNDSIERALAQAEAQAWTTPFPSLFFPPLARISLSHLGASPASPSLGQP